MLNKRIARVAENMRACGLKQILISAPPSIRYLTGVMQHPGERLFALLLNDDGEMALYANRLFAIDASSISVPLIEFDDTEDSIAILARDIKPGVLGIDKVWPSGFLLRLLSAAKDTQPRLGSAPVDDARMFKDEIELCALRESSRLNDQVLGELISTLNIGQREREVAGLYSAMALNAGSEDNGFALICFGANCAEPHHISDNTELVRGDAVILDVGLTVRGYASDMTRTVFFGSATDEQKRVYDAVLRANLAAVKATRPGVKLSDIDRAARRVIEDAGYGDYFIHRTGHGIGLEGHEPPDVSSTSEIVARPGMVFSIEPGIYLKGKFGVRIEDLVHVTEDGCEVLNGLFREMTIL